MTNPEASIHIEQSEGKANIIMDMSIFDLFHLCEMKYHYRHGLQRTLPIQYKAKPLDLGGLAHEGLEVYYKGLQQGVHYNDRMHACLSRIQLVSSDSEVSNSEPADVMILMKAVEESCDYWRDEDETLEILEVENPFMYLLHEDEYVRILITGKIDLLVNKPAIGNNAGYKNLPYDHKTFSRDFEVIRLSNQFMNYCSAVGSVYLEVNRIGLQKTLKPEDKFKRVMLSYDPVMLEDWRENIKNVILDEYLNCVATGRWKMNFTSCYKFNRKCEYYGICEASGQEAKLSKLENDFVPASPWDVTATLNKGE